MLDKPVTICFGRTAATAVDKGELVTDENRGRVFRKEVIKVGQFYNEGDPFEITSSDIDRWVAGIEVQLSHGIRIDVPSEHTDDPDRSRGKVIGAEREGDSMFAYLEFSNDKHAELASTAETSIYSPPSYEVGTTGEVLYRPIRHVALTQDPVVNGLKPFELILSRNPPKRTNQVDPIEFAKSLGLELAADVTPEDATAAIAAGFKQRDDQILELSKKKAESKKEPETPVDPAMLTLSRDNRTMKIDQLVLSRHITPATAKSLKETHCSDEAITLCLSNQVAQKQFEDSMATYGNQTPIVADAEDGSSTGPQTLKLSKTEILSSEKNPLLAACADK